MEGAKESRDPQLPKRSARLLEREERKRKEEERKAEKERKRAKTMFQRKNKVIGPQDLLVDTTTGKIHLGPEFVSEDVKVKVELNDLEGTLESSGFSEGQGDVLVTQEVNMEAEDAQGMEDKDGNLADVEVKLEENVVVQQRGIQEENEDNGHAIGGEFQDVIAERTGSPSLTAVFEQLNEMKERLKEQDQKNAQLTTELAAVKAEVVCVKEKYKVGEVKINELQETIVELQLQLSSTKDIPEATAAKKGLASTNNRLQGQVTQGPLLAQNDKDLKGNSDEDGSDDMAMFPPDTIENCETAVVEHPDDESLPEEKSRDESVKAPIFEAVLNILVERRRTISGNINWRSVRGVIKKCRLVCKSWKASVDSILQTHPSHLELFKPFDFETIDDKTFSPCPLNLSTVGHSFNVRLSLDIAPSKMGQFIINLPAANVHSNYNPVPTRHLSVRTRLASRLPLPIITHKPTGNVYHLRDYLRVFGHQIWYLRLELGYGVRGSDFHKVCFSISEILHLVPNLRLLSFDVDFAVSEEKRAFLSGSEIEHQFPYMKHLVAVECLQENPLIVQILKANRHVRSLAFYQLCHRQSTAIFKLDLPNLSELFISYYVLIEMEVFGKANVTWKIRKLSFHCHSIQFMKDGLTVFGESLEDLTLVFGYYNFPGKGLRLKLPRLKSLRVETKNWGKFKWGVFLANLKLLETLEMVVNVEDYALIGSFHEEKLWLSMPQLRIVTLVATRSSRYSINREEERKVFELKRFGLPTVKFNYIKV